MTFRHSICDQFPHDAIIVNPDFYIVVFGHEPYSHALGAHSPNLRASAQKMIALAKLSEGIAAGS